MLPIVCSAYIAVMLAFAAPAFCQELDTPPLSGNTSRFERTGRHTFDAVTEMLSLHDIPLGAAYFVKPYALYDDPADKPILLAPLGFEQDIAANVGVEGSVSVGDVHPDYLVNGILTARVLYVIGEDLLTEDGSSKNSYKHAFGLYKSMAYTEVATQFMKNLVNRERPDASDTKSFFSGHTSLTFAMCSFLHRELDDAIMRWDGLSEDTRRWLRLSAFTTLYGWAGYVGYSRMHDKKHYVTDVLAGALIGTLIGNFVFDTYLGHGESLLRNIGVGATQEGAPAVQVSVGL